MQATMPLLMLLFELRRQPIKSFIKPITTSRTCCLDVPVAISERVEAQFVCDLCCIHGIWQVLKRRKRDHVYAKQYIVFFPKEGGIY